jgi:hypothetical protein
MKIDLDYMSKFLAVFTESENAHITIQTLVEKGFPLNIDGHGNEQLKFHLGISLDNGFIGTQFKNTASTLKDILLSIDMDGTMTGAVVGLRLTQKGHDFANMLNNKEVLQRLKAEFKDAPFDVVFDGGKKLLEHFFKKKLDILISE